MADNWYIVPRIVQIYNYYNMTENHIPQKGNYTTYVHTVFVVQPPSVASLDQPDRFRSD